MINQRLGRLLSFNFVSCCFCVGIGIGVFIRFGQLQASDATTKPTKVATGPKLVPDFKEFPPFLPDPTAE